MPVPSAIGLLRDFGGCNDGCGRRGRDRCAAPGMHVPCLSVHTLTTHPREVIGWLLIAVGLLLYVGSIALSIMRIHGQYSSAMPGRGRLRMGAALAAAGKFWPFLLAVAAGVALLVLVK